MLSIISFQKYVRSWRFFKNMSSVISLSIKEAISLKPLNRTLALRGWVQAIRKHKDLVFVDLIDGGSLDRLQVIIKDEENKTPPNYGSSISVQGILLESQHKGQDVELICDTWQTIGSCSDDYPFFARHSHTTDYIRQQQHLRPKTKTFKSILRVRNAATVAVHNYFQDEEFVFIHTPIITLNDCEGGGEVFYVEPRKDKSSEETVIETLKNGKRKEISKNETLNPISNVTNEKNIENSTEDEFFKYPAFLTVSGQFHLEAMAVSLLKVYNFGPTFRAEKTQSNSHLSEFSMIEAEMAFVESLDTLTNHVENLLKNISKHVADTCSKEIDQIFSKYTKGHQNYLNQIVTTSFLRMSYSEAVNILEKHEKSLKVKLKWGEDLGSEHKKFIIKYCNNVPVFITEFPASIKPFYMKTDSKGKGLCFDLFAPFGNEICSGSLREENFDILKKRLEDMRLIEPVKKEDLDHSETNPLAWYLEIRKYGSVPHGGFGIGFDRMLQTILGISNIRDVVPFPRWRDHCKC